MGEGSNVFCDVEGDTLLYYTQPTFDTGIMLGDTSGYFSAQDYVSYDKETRRN